MSANDAAPERPDRFLPAVGSSNCNPVEEQFCQQGGEISLVLVFPERNNPREGVGIAVCGEGLLEAWSTLSASVTETLERSSKAIHHFPANAASVSRIELLKPCFARWTEERLIDSVAAGAARREEESESPRDTVR